MPGVVVLTPSRGLIHSRTVEAVCGALSAARDRLTCRGWLISHDLPIPEAHETLAARGLDVEGADLLWYVEEDVLPPPGALTALYERQQATGAGLVALDYPVGEAPTRSCVTRNRQGHVLWAGLGCTLITRQTLERLPRPWFRTDCLYQLRDDHLIACDTPARYGGHDVAFYLAARAAGIGVEAIDGPDDILCGHARLRTLGAAHTNQGAHVIETLTQIQERS